MVNRKRFIRRLVPLAIILILLASTIPIAWNNDVGSAATSPGTTDDTTSVISAGAANTIEVMLFGPAQYNRTTEEPNTSSDTFPAIEGEGWITVINGDEDGNHRVSSAIIMVNGDIIFTINDFNQKVGLLEGPILLTEDNVITVEMRSNPGGYLTIQITQEIEADAGAVIGPEGGVVEVTDPESAIKGTRIDIPEGEATENLIIISEVEDPPGLPNPGDIAASGPTISIEASNALVNFAALTIPCPAITDVTQDIKVYYYNEGTSEWEEHPTIFSNAESGTITFLVEHLSWYRAIIEATTIDIASYALPDFYLPCDRTSFDNYYYGGSLDPEVPYACTQGMCQGMSSLVKYWYENKDTHLRCAYSEEAGAPVACNLQLRHEYFLNVALLLAELSTTGVFDATDVWQSCLISIKNGDMPLIAMSEIPIVGERHCVAAYKWEYSTIGDILGYLYIYDPVEPENADLKITCRATTLLGIPIVTMEYSNYGYNFKYFANSFIYSSNSFVEDLISDLPPDNPEPQGCWKLTQLTHNDAWDWYPQISGDGTKIAFHSGNIGDDYEIFAMNSDGTGLKQLTSNTVDDMIPTINADGTKIAFMSVEENGQQHIGPISIVNSDGTGEVMQLTGNLEPVYFPQISGDGTKIAFIWYDGSYFGGNLELFVVNSDGSGLTQLETNGVGEEVSISGDGTQIAFISYSDDPYDSGIFVMNSDGSGLTQLTDGGWDGDPHISADGTRIAFRRYIPGDRWEIFVMNSDGTGLKRLTHNPAYDQRPSINADGTRIAFSSEVDGDYEVFIVNSDGSGLTQLTHNDAWDIGPSISADGTKIAFLSQADADTEIFLLEYVP